MAQLPDAPWVQAPAEGVLPDAPWASAPASGALPDAPWAAASTSQAPATDAGLIDYPIDTGKAILSGAVEAAVTSPMRGYAGQHSAEVLTEPNRREIALQKIMEGQDIDTAVAQAQVEGKPIPVTEHPLYKAADTILGALPKEKGVLNPVFRDVASGFGSVGGNIASMLIPGFNALGIPNVVAQGAGEATERAVKAGATPDQIMRAARFGNISGATEFADALLIHTGTWGKVAGLMKQVGVAALKGALIEGGQEGLQQFIQNAIAKGVYKPEQSLSEDVAYNAVIGGIVGGTIGGAFHGGERASTPPTQDTINQGVAPPTVTSELPVPGAAPITTPMAPTTTPTVPPTDPHIAALTPTTASVAPTPVAPVPTPTPLNEAEVAAKTFDPAIAADMRTKGLILPTNPDQLSLDSLIAPTPEGSSGLKAQDVRLNAEEATQTKVQVGMNRGQIMSILGSGLYGDESQTTNVSVKELVQNSFDAIKGMLEKRQMDEGNIDISMDPKKRIVTIHDDGAGMTKETLSGPFFEPGGSHKETTRSSGGFGIAKLLPFYGNKGLRVKTMRDGKVHEINTTGSEVHAMVELGREGPTIFSRDATAEDRKEFPKGHGTRIEIVVPEQYIDHSTGETKSIAFDAGPQFHNVLQSSPLFENINVKFNGQELPLGKNFPIENFTQLTNVNFDWGSARVYVTHTPDLKGSGKYSNVHVLSNGLWQFDSRITKDPRGNYGESIPYEFYIDLRVKEEVKAGKPGYPIAPNRQQFSAAGEKGFGNLFKYLSLIYQKSELSAKARNFGVMQYLDYDMDRKVVTGSEMVKLEPKVPTTKNPLDDLKTGHITVKDGLLVVNGREIPNLTPQEIEKFRIDPNEIRVDQSEIDSKRIILHDNTDIIVSPSEKRGMVEYGREKFGKRFDEYTFSMGKAFDELRGIIMKIMPPIKPPKMRGQLQTLEDEFNALMTLLPPEKRSPQTPSMVESLAPTKNGYEGLADLGIGVSLDPGYRGVHITGLPFNGMFINPFLPEFSDNPIEAAVYMVTTMLHEIAHYKIQTEEIGPELQKFITMLDTNTKGVDFMAFKQKIVNIVAAYEDVFKHMNGVFTSGDFTLQPRGQRLKNARSLEEGNGSLSEVVAKLGEQSTAGEKLSHWVAASDAVAQGEPGRPRAALQTSSDGSAGPADNGRARNYAALRGIDAGISAPPQQPEVNILRETVNNSPVSGAPTEALKGLKEAASHADRFNWMYKYLAGVTQLLDGNPYFQPLRKYVERVRQMHSDESTIHDAALRLMKDWRRLGATGMKNLENLILSVQDMPYLTAGERSMQLWRHPTAAEFSALVAKNKVGEEGLKIYNRMRQMDETFLRLLEEEAKQNAIRKIPDPIKLAVRIDDIEVMGRQARAQPFFPFTRFGRYYVVGKDAAGKVIHFETFEPRRVVGVTVKRAEKFQQARIRELQRKHPTYTFTEGVLPETAEPLVGLPTLLLQELLGEDVSFTPDQIEAIKLMQNSRNPAMALRSRAKYGEQPVGGYSLDLPRSFAKYFFHGGRYYAKVKHAWALKGHIAEAQVVPGNKAGLIASYMGDHLTNTILDAKGDFGFVKGAIFLWAMGYVPAAATQNLTQTPMVTYPFLAGKFGDLRATKHLVKSMIDVTNFYKRGHYLPDPTSTTSLDFEMKALGYGIKTGRISETQAPELAGLAGGGKLISGMGGNRFEQGAAKFQEKAAWAFEMAEQFNRRVAFRAALRLAQENPSAKFVEESVRKYEGEFKQLVPEFGEAKARSIVTAIHSVDQTQFVYARYARSRLFRGPRNILFVFKQYLQSLLWMLGNNKADVLPRWLIITMIMGGLGGVPGYDDLKGIFRAIGIWFFGKDVNLDRLIRDYALQWSNGTVAPDLVLHGLSRKGFGLPALMDLMGSAPSRGLVAPGFQHSGNVPFPVLDRSRAIGVGNILPLDIGKMFVPTDKLEKTIADETQRASGAVFSVGFNMYKAIMDTDPAFYPGSYMPDWKRWEKMMPRALSSATRSYRAFSEGRERGGSGGMNSATTIVPYDSRDTEQMLEALAVAGGYQPLRVQAKWDLIMAQAEASAFYDLRKKNLMEEWFEALKGQDPKELEAVRDAVIRYNKELPDYAKANAISADTIKKSMQTRERTLISRELGVPVQKSKIGISQEMQRLFPESTVDVRRVR